MSATGRLSGQLSRSGARGAGRCNAASVRGPAIAVSGMPAQCWKRRMAAATWLLYSPAIVAEGKPCQPSMNWSAATSQPVVPRLMRRLPRRCVANGPSAFRVCLPAMPSTARASRRWKACTATVVVAPAMPSIGPACSRSRLSAIWSAAIPGFPGVAGAAGER
jgi:hypothetical protein